MAIFYRGASIHVLTFFLALNSAWAAHQPACSSPLDSRIQNSCRVTAELWRGAKPDRAGASALAELGVKTIVNLELLHDDRSTFRQVSLPSNISAQIGYFRVRDWEPLVVFKPSEVDEHVAQFIAITRTQAKPLYVHCRSGQNRTGVMVAAYRVFNGMEIEQAIAEMQAYQGIWFDFDAAYIRTLTPERRAALEPLIQTEMQRIPKAAQITCGSERCQVQ